MTYDYDTVASWRAAIAGKIEMKLYLEMLRLQRTSLPAYAAKMRQVENHDVDRIQQSVKTGEKAIAWTAFAVFNSGTFLVSYKIWLVNFHLLRFVDICGSGIRKQKNALTF